jgi:aldose 1-epimerase
MKYIVTVIVCFVFFSIASFGQNKKDMVSKNLYGTLPDGRQVYEYTLTNSSGSKVKVISFGAAVTSIVVPDRSGRLGDVVLGYDSLEGYETGNTYFGAIVGRYGNRIGKGRFSLDGKTYQLTINDGENHLHGGTVGFNKRLWDAEEVSDSEGASVELKYVSPDGEEGYPGTLTLTVRYTLTDSNALQIHYEATTDAPTILNPTHHSYFNLSGIFTKPITDEMLTIEADSMTEIDSELITTGKIISVTNTPLDFRTPAEIGARINEPYYQLKYGKGYDFNWVIRNHNGTVRKAAEVYDPISGRVLTVYTDQPGIQFYSGNFLDGTAKGKNGIMYAHRTGLCLEAQDYPDSPNKPQFPSPVLRPGQTYHQTTIYQFSTK